MESMQSTPEEAALALSAAEAARTRLAQRLELPSAFYVSVGAAIAAQIGSAAVGISYQNGRGLVLVAVGAVVFALVAVLQLAAFRRRNGVWLAGLASRVVLGGATSASAVYVVALGAAVWAAFAAAWWLVAAASLAGGVGYALCGRHWLRIYRSAPEAHGRPESATFLALAVAVALAGLVVLVFNR